MAREMLGYEAWINEKSLQLDDELKKVLLDSTKNIFGEFNVIINKDSLKKDTIIFADRNTISKQLIGFNFQDILEKLIEDIREKFKNVDPRIFNIVLEATQEDIIEKFLNIKKNAQLVEDVLSDEINYLDYLLPGQAKKILKKETEIDMTHFKYFSLREMNDNS